MTKRPRFGHELAVAGRVPRVVAQERVILMLLTSVHGNCGRKSEVVA